MGRRPAGRGRGRRVPRRRRRPGRPPARLRPRSRAPGRRPGRPPGAGLQGEPDRRRRTTLARSGPTSSSWATRSSTSGRPSSRSGSASSSGPTSRSVEDWKTRHLPAAGLAPPRPGRHRPRLEARPRRRPRLPGSRPGPAGPGRGADRLRYSRAMSDLWGIPRDSLTQEDRTWALVAHIGTLVAGVHRVGLPRAAPGAAASKGDSSPFVRRHAVESLNFQISLLIYSVVLGIVAAAAGDLHVGLGLLVVGCPVGLLLAVVVLVLDRSWRTFRASNGEAYEYPLHDPPGRSSAQGSRSRTTASASSRPRAGEHQPHPPPARAGPARPAPAPRPDRRRRAAPGRARRRAAAPAAPAPPAGPRRQRLPRVGRAVAAAPAARRTPRGA